MQEIFFISILLSELLVCIVHECASCTNNYSNCIIWNSFWSFLLFHFNNYWYYILTIYYPWKNLDICLNFSEMSFFKKYIKNVKIEMELRFYHGHLSWCDG